MTESNWRRINRGGWLSRDGRWYIRGPIFGARMYWLYHNGSRYTPTGLYDDAVSFRTPGDAMKFVEGIDTAAHGQ